MTLTSLGRVAVPTPGTPVALPVPPRTTAARLVLQAAPTKYRNYLFRAKRA